MWKKKGEGDEEADEGAPVPAEVKAALAAQQHSSTTALAERSANTGRGSAQSASRNSCLRRFPPLGTASRSNRSAYQSPDKAKQVMLVVVVVVVVVVSVMLLPVLFFPLLAVLREPPNSLLLFFFAVSFETPVCMCLSTE